MDGKKFDPQKVIDFIEGDALSDWVILRDANSESRKLGKPEPYSSEYLDKFDRVLEALNKEDYRKAFLLYLDTLPEGWEVWGETLTDLKNFAKYAGVDAQKLETLVPMGPSADSGRDKK